MNPKTIIIMLMFSASVFATGTPPPPPPQPTPVEQKQAQGQAQGQLQGQAQGQAQGQVQGQTAVGKGGSAAGGNAAGGNATGGSGGAGGQGGQGGSGYAKGGTAFQGQASSNKNKNANDNLNNNISKGGKGGYASGGAGGSSSAGSSSKSDSYSEGSISESISESSVGNTLAGSQSGAISGGNETAQGVAVDASDNSVISYKNDYEYPVSTASALFTQVCQTGASAQTEKIGISIVNSDALCDTIKTATLYWDIHLLEHEHGDHEQAAYWKEKYIEQMKDVETLMDYTEEIAIADRFAGFMIRPLGVLALLIFLL